MSNSEQKICQNCKQSFVIEPSDFDFYAKIKVPPPTWCAECRLIRRMAVRNERTLYKRKCDVTGENIIAVCSIDKPFKVYKQDYWWSDKWDPFDYGKDYDFSKPFFKQFRGLSERVPMANVFLKNSATCSYCNVAVDCKNCYLYFGSGRDEDVMYASGLNTCKNCLDCLFDVALENCYETIDSFHSSSLFFSQHSTDCMNSRFLYNCRGCSNCFGCINLRLKSYCIFNKQYSKDDYYQRIKEFHLFDYKELEKMKEYVANFFLKFIRPPLIMLKSENVSGQNIYNSKNCTNCFDVYNVEHCKDLVRAPRGASTAALKDVFSSMNIGWGGELGYEDVSIIRFYNIKFSSFVWDGHDIEYSDNCHNCSHLFACIGLRNKQYCILNKQYTKEEYSALVPRIIEHMNTMPYTDKKGRVYKYGEFFPSELSPFCYNETVAQEYFPLTKEQAIEQGYSWKDPEPRNYQIDIKSEDLADNIKDVKDEIIGKVIECSHKGQCNEQCTEAFRIIEAELQFYRRMNLPLPRLCPNCRHYQRLKQRNPLRLWTRQCMCQVELTEGRPPEASYRNTCQHEHGDQPCANTFETSYAPDRPEIVYCEQCYLKEVV